MTQINKKETQPLLSRERLAVKMAGCIVSVQRQIAAYLNRLTANLPSMIRLALLLVICLLFAAFNLYLLIHSITQ